MVTMQELMAKAHPAVCGATEREVVISSEKAAEAIRLIKSKGFVFVGSGPAGFGKTKIWFVSGATALL